MQLLTLLASHFKVNKLTQTINIYFFKQTKKSQNINIINKQKKTRDKEI